MSVQSGPYPSKPKCVSTSGKLTENTGTRFLAANSAIGRPKRLYVVPGTSSAPALFLYASSNARPSPPSLSCALSHGRDWIVIPNVLAVSHTSLQSGEVGFPREKHHPCYLRQGLMK